MLENLAVSSGKVESDLQVIDRTSDVPEGVEDSADDWRAVVITLHHLEPERRLRDIDTGISGDEIRADHAAEQSLRSGDILKTVNLYLQISGLHHRTRLGMYGIESEMIGNVLIRIPGDNQMLRLHTDLRDLTLGRILVRYIGCRLVRIGTSIVP